MDTAGNVWSDPSFDDSQWTRIPLPDIGKGRDRFYRGRFELSDPLEPLALFFRCDDGCDISVNGSPLGSYGPNGTCHQAGCVNLSDCFYKSFISPILVPQSLLVSGTNIVAVHVSNGPNRLFFGMSVAPPTNNVACGNGRRDANEQCEPVVTAACGSGLVCVAPGQPNQCTCQPPPPRKRPVIFIPGIYGSEIRYQNKQGWPTGDNCTLSRLRPPDNGVPPLASVSLIRCTAGTADGGCSVAKTACGFSQTAYYDGLPNALGDLSDHELWIFPYDWRVDVQRSGSELETFVNSIRTYSGYDRVDIVVHSMGGLVAKEFLSRTNRFGRYNEPKVRRMIFVGTPHFGAPKAMLGLFGGLNDFSKYGVAGLQASVLGYAAQNMPSAYQLLPSGPLVSQYPVLAVRNGGLSFVPLRTYQSFLEQVGAYKWLHTNCLSCRCRLIPGTIVPACVPFVERLNGRMGGWVAPHRRWDLWYPLDAGLDAYVLYGNSPLLDGSGGGPFGFDGTIQMLQIGVTPQITLQAGYLDPLAGYVSAWGKGDLTVPVESARADGVDYFVDANPRHENRRFEFYADHTGLLSHTGVHQCIEALLRDEPDTGSCSDSQFPAVSSASGAAPDPAFLEVTLGGGDAAMVLTDPAANMTGKVNQISHTDIPGSLYLDMGTAQVAVAPADQALTIAITATEGATLHLRLRTLIANVPTQERHYDFILAAGDQATLAWSRSAGAPLEIDRDGNGSIDAEVVPVDLPVANPGNAQTVRGGIEATLDGSRSVAHNGGVLTYQWTQIDGPSVTLSDATAAVAQFSAPSVSEDTSLAFALEVASGGVTSRSISVSVLVRNCGPEHCNGLDDNCDGMIDESNPEGGAACDPGLGGTCSAGALQCNTGKLICVPNNADCVSSVCATDPDCDDGLFCNGQEACFDGTCAPSETPPCQGPCDACNEDALQCTTLSDCSCPDHCNLDVDVPPQLVLQPSESHDFGAVTVGDQQSFVFTVQNQGGGVLAVTASTTCDRFSVSPSVFTLVGWAEAPISVTFVPNGVGSVVCPLDVVTDGGEVHIDLSGTGVAPPTSMPTLTELPTPSATSTLIPAATITPTLPPTVSPALTPTLTPIATPLPTNAPMPTVTAVLCIGDCNHGGSVSVDELVKGVNIALGNASLSDCKPFDRNNDGRVTVDELVKAVSAALSGC